MSGNLFVVSAPSGAGKTSLVKALLAQDDQVQLSVSYTTRPPRAGEKPGEDYFFVDRDTFQSMVDNGDFLESAEVYGNYYGTSQQWIAERLKQGGDTLLEIDWQGAQQVRRLFPSCISIFILPPSLEVLAQRLKGRGKDSDAVIETRMAAAQHDVSHVAAFDYVIINDQLEVALQQLQSVIMAARLTSEKQIARHQDLINHLQDK